MSKGDNTRQMIIEKAADLFNRYGFDGCSLSDIMKVTSLKKGGIYNHFKNKDEIALAAFDHMYSQVVLRYRSGITSSDSPSDKLKRFFNMFRNYFDHPELKGGCPIANTAVYSADGHSLLRKRVIAAIDQMENYLFLKLEEGKDAGEFYYDLNTKDMSKMILSTLEGAIIISRVRRDKNYLENVVNQLEKFVLDQALI